MYQVSIFINMKKDDVIRLKCREVKGGVLSTLGVGKVHFTGTSCHWYSGESDDMTPVPNVQDTGSLSG